MYIERMNTYMDIYTYINKLSHIFSSSETAALSTFIKSNFGFVLIKLSFFVNPFYS